MNSQPRRVKFLMCDPAGFMALFKEGMKFRKNFRIVKGLPKDAKLISVAYDMQRGGIMMIVESQEYDEVQPTNQPPIQQVEIEVG